DSNYALYNGIFGPNQPYWRINTRQSNYLVSAGQYIDCDCPGYGAKTKVLVTNFRGAISGNDISASIGDIKDGLSNTFLAGESWNATEKGAGNACGPYWGTGCHTSTHGQINPPTGGIYAGNNPGPWLNALEMSPNGIQSWVAGYYGGIANYPFAWT